MSEEEQTLKYLSANTEDGTLVKRLQDRRGRGITVDEMLENIQEIKN